jgi:membrane fusion protein
VLQVSSAPVPVAELQKLALWQSETSEPLYRVTVSLDRQAVSTPTGLRPLLPGMQLEADVLLEKRRLVAWLFEPLMGWWRRV